MFNVLVVEDEKNLRKLMTAYLKKNQYNTFEAEDGVKALEVLENTHKSNCFKKSLSRMFRIIK